jgi:hypothetical protein
MRRRRSTWSGSHLRSRPGYLLGIQVDALVHGGIGITGASIGRRSRILEWLLQLVVGIAGLKMHNLKK